MNPEDFEMMDRGRTASNKLQDTGSVYRMIMVKNTGREEEIWVHTYLILMEH